MSVSRFVQQDATFAGECETYRECLDAVADPDKLVGALQADPALLGLVADLLGICTDALPGDDKRMRDTASRIERRVRERAYRSSQRLFSDDSPGAELEESL